MEETTTINQPHWWLEREFWLVLALVTAIHTAWLSKLPPRGEETRRACVAREMLRTGDWIVPREQGAIFADRPPLQNWVIALSMMALGEQSALAIRLPSVVSMVILSMIIYAYSRQFVGRMGAGTSALAFASFGQELQLGRLGETEALFSLFTSSSLLIWHHGYSRGWRPAAYWSAGYTLAALAALTKGPQGPVYFTAGCGAYLLWRRDPRAMLNLGHLVGLLAGVAIVAAWHVPFAQRTPTPLVLKTWGYLAAARYDYSDISRILSHAVSFPFEVLGCLAPWSLLLFMYVFRGLRRSLGPARDAAVFMSLAAGLAFATCWIAPHARGRYFMPLHAVLAPLVGIAVERSWQSVRHAPWRKAWHALQIGFAIVMAAGGAAVFVASCLPFLRETPLAAPLGIGAAYALTAIGLGAFTFAFAPNGARPNPFGSALAAAAFLGVTYSGIVQQAFARRSNDVAGAVAAVRRQLPTGARLESVGVLHHAFAYHYFDDIRLAPAGRPSGEYFCFQDTPDFPAPAIDFPWVQVAVVACDRNVRAEPRERVFVGRRLLATARVSEHQR